MKALPEGKSLGWMQAPASWISSHTVRFVGIVRVAIQDGEGFILIKKGRPLFHYFKQGTIELKGNSARDYFSSHPVIDFNLCKYSPDEIAWALKVCNIEDHEPAVPKEPAVSGPVSGEPAPRPADARVAKPLKDTRIPDPVVVSPQVHRDGQKAVVSSPPLREHSPAPQPAAAPVAQPARDARIPDSVGASPQVHRDGEKAAVSGPASREHPPAPRPAAAPVAQPARDARIPDSVWVVPQVHPDEARVAVPQPDASDEPDQTALSSIMDLKGILAVSVFNDSHTFIMMGDEDREALVKIARKMLMTAQDVNSRLRWGSFVHMTLQIPEGNMIIAPYHDNYLCMLTTRTINIGHIRRILRDLQQKETSIQVL